MNSVHWITPPDGMGENITFLARRAFDVLKGNVAGSRRLRVCADWRYALYVNDEFIGSGPVRGSRRRYFYDEYAVTLREGENFVVVEVHSPGRATFGAVPVIPALWLEIEDLVATDADWQMQIDPSRRREAPLYTPQIGYSECRDLRRELGEWTTVQIVEGVPGGRQLVACDIPPLTHLHHSPQKLISCGSVPASPCDEHDGIRYAEQMQTESHEEKQSAATWVDGELQFTLTATNSAYAILDFEQETYGSVLLDVDAPAGTILDLGYGDALYDGRVKTCSEPYRFADRYILREGRQQIEHRLQDRGFRYLQIVARGFDRAVVLHTIEVEQRAYPLPARATFACDDPFLNRLWAMADRTLALCATDTFVDCPWREQALWLNDMLVVYPFYLAFTGDATLPARCLRLAADGQRANGLIPSVYPSAEVRDSTFPSLSAIYTLMLADYHLYTGDVALVCELLPVMEKALAVYDTWSGPDGLIPDQTGMWNFIEWSSPGSRADLPPGSITTILNVLIAAAYQAAATLHRVTGNSARAAVFQQKQEHLLAAIRNRFWLTDRERLCNGSFQPASFSQHPHAVGLHYQLLDEKQRGPALAALLDPSVAQTDLYFQHFVLSALSSGGRADAALAAIRQLWGPMVESDSPTIWETTRGKDEFNGVGSLCHAFACAPLYFMQTVLLGVRPRQPGFREFSFAPQSIGLTSACGTVPTPHGLLSIEWHCQPDGSLRGVIDIPPSTTAIFPDGSQLSSGSHRFHLPTTP